MTLSISDNAPDTAQNLGAITGAGSATLSTYDITSLTQDPIDVFRVTTSGSVASLSFSFSMTTDLSNLSEYLQFIAFIPISGFETAEEITYATGSDPFFEALLEDNFLVGLGTPSPITLDITPGADAVFSIAAVGYDYDNTTSLGGFGNLPNMPDIPELATDEIEVPGLVPMEYSLSVAFGSDTGGSDNGGGSEGGTGGETSGTIFDLASAFSAAALANLVDFGGNALGAVEDWVEIGRSDIQGDGDIEVVMINEVLGRWATLGITEDGTIDFSANSTGGDTRVVGTYEDPLVALGQVIAGGPNDSQTRFANDIATGNLGSVLGAGDYDADGFQEVYFGLKDATAVLHAYMHADGNIRYANYQSEADLGAFMQANGIAANVYDSWI
ncbi:hypothetical protein Z945_2933 [Sulfitobacter noctilucae]|uniref:hypothetical protein n=1 Tax=Sulfitobacter noctilucae TaxID=1342302 RepID=UPI00046A36D2|nr:hypothetical protein [Sulfitobacter noctilucae]KIN75034.1 hypothetical protein Z945_2933 [Sulfitobacter noctilucae]